MSMYTHFVNAIKDNPAELDATLRRIDAYHIRGKLTDVEREELIAQARSMARPALDTSVEIQRLWAAMRAMQEEIKALREAISAGGEDGGESGGEDTDGAEDAEDGANVSPAEDWPAWTQPIGAHDAYYAGAVVRWDGKVYKCIAPQGVACIWSPETMPGYWVEVQIEETEEITDSDDVGGEV